MSSQSGLRVRQHHRREIELPVEFIVAEEYRDQVRFGSKSTAINEYSLRGTSVDISPGGMGFTAGQFLPRQCEGLLRVFDPMPIGTRADGMPMLEVAFEQRVKVRRVQMTSHEPTYFIGVSFADPANVEPDIGNRRMLLTAAGDGVGARPPTPSRGGPDA